MPHALHADYVRDQLVPRTVDVNGKTYFPEGEYVLYWMQSTQRLDENWGLRAAIRTADRVNRPLVIHQGLDPSYPYAADRHHTFILQGARDTARDADAHGLYYQFVLRPGRDDDRRVVDRLAARAYVVITDLFPTAGIRERVERFAARGALPCAGHRQCVHRTKRRVREAGVCGTHDSPQDCQAARPQH